MRKPNDLTTRNSNRANLFEMTTALALFLALYRNRVVLCSSEKQEEEQEQEESEPYRNDYRS